MTSVQILFSKTSTHWVNVRIYETRRAMRSYTSKLGHSRPNNAVGVCWRVTDPDNDQCVAQIHLCRDHLQMDTIVHEAVHAAWDRVNRMGLPLDEGDFQEYLATAAGLLVEKILDWLSKEGIEVNLNVVPKRKVITDRVRK